MSLVAWRDVLACPVCHASLDASATDALRCERCDERYAVANGVADLRTPDARRAMDARSPGSDGWARWHEAIRGLESWRATRARRSRGGPAVSDGADDLSALEMLEHAGVRGVVVDVGAKRGERSRLLLPGTRYVGIDPFARALDVQSAATAQMACGLAEDLPIADGAADTVMSLAAFDYFIDPSRAVDEMARVLKPGGTLALMVSVVAPSVARARGAPTRIGRARAALRSVLDVGLASGAGLALAGLRSTERAHTNYFTRDDVLGLVQRRFVVRWTHSVAQATSEIVYIAATRTPG